MDFFPLGDGELILLAYVRSIHHREPINLDDWRKIHVPEFTENPFRIRSLIPLQDAVRKVTEALSTKLRHSVMEMILNGDTWEEIPFDWTGIKRAGTPSVSGKLSFQRNVGLHELCPRALSVSTEPTGAVGAWKLWSACGN